MLIDDLRTLNIQFGGRNIRDAVVFRMNEKADNFGSKHVSNQLEPLPSLLPYDNMVVHFDQFLLWYLSKDASENKLLIQCALFSPDSTDIYSHSQQPFLILESSINTVTRQCDGMNIYYPYDRKYQWGEGEEPSDPPGMEGLSDLMSNAYKYLHAFLEILSCKNIKTELETPDEKIQKKRSARGKLPLVSFYTLKIQNIAASHEATQSGLWSNRIHFCRGHMREYTADAPLFGKITGRFWIAPHVRGDKSKGVIVKDYEVNTSNKPQED